MYIDHPTHRYVEWAIFIAYCIVQVVKNCHNTRHEKEKYENIIDGDDMMMAIALGLALAPLLPQMITKMITMLSMIISTAKVMMIVMMIQW